MLAGVVCALLTWIGLQVAATRMGLPSEIFPMIFCASQIAFIGGAGWLGPYLMDRGRRNWRLTERPKNFSSTLRMDDGRAIPVHQFQHQAVIHVVEQAQPNRTEIQRPPISYDDLRRVAQALQGGAAFSYPGLVDPGKVLTRNQFDDLRDYAIAKRWYKLKREGVPKSGMVQTAIGAAVMQAVLTHPEPPEWYVTY